MDFQFYNRKLVIYCLELANSRSPEGTTEYTTCDGLITASSSTWPETALFQIAANGVDENKLVIGKPAQQKDATNGYMSTSALAQCVAQAHSKGWGKLDVRPPKR